MIPDRSEIDLLLAGVEARALRVGARLEAGLEFLDASHAALDVGWNLALGDAFPPSWGASGGIAGRHLGLTLVGAGFFGDRKCRPRGKTNKQNNNKTAQFRGP